MKTSTKHSFSVKSSSFETKLHESYHINPYNEWMPKIRVQEHVSLFNPIFIPFSI